MSVRERERKRQVRRRAFHLAIALILIFCALSPFLESAVNLNDSVFATGYDNESTIAILVLLLELVISFAGLLAVYFYRTVTSDDQVVVKNSRVVSEAIFGIKIPALSPPPPLRI